MIRHPMKRHVLNVVTALSVVLCAAVVALWVRSYRVADELTWKRTQYVYSASESDYMREPTWIGRIDVDGMRSNRGILGAYHKQSVDHFFLGAQNVKDWSEEYPPGRSLLWDRDEPLDRFSFRLEGFRGILNPRTFLHRFGFFIGRYQIEGMAAGMADFNVGEVEVPMWFLAALSALLPLLRAIHLWRLRRKRAPGLCRQCGYSLTGNVSGICPECGMAISAGASREQGPPIPRAWGFGLLGNGAAQAAAPVSMAARDDRRRRRVERGSLAAVRQPESEAGSAVVRRLLTYP